MNITTRANMQSSDSYTTNSNGVTQNVQIMPVQTFALQVKGVGGTASAWNVALYASLDGVNFSPTPLVSHVSGTDTDGAIKYVTASPSLYYRTVMSGLTLGPSSAVVATVLGVQ